MAKYPGSIPYTGYVAPASTDDIYAVTDERFNRGGYRSVANETARLAITEDRRAEGMLVKQLDTNSYWTLNGGITNSDWQELSDVANNKVYQLYQPDGTNPFVYTDNSGILHIDGDIVQNGSTYETHAEEFYTTKDIIFTRDGAIAGLSAGELTGIQAKLYDGVNDGQLVFDGDGIARVGDVGSLQPLATREEVPTDGYFAKWNDANTRFETVQITESDISDLQDYLLSETDPTVGSHIKDITTTQISNWDNAYSWGDHSLVGYLTSYTETDPIFNAHTVSNIIDGTGFLINDGAGNWSYDNTTYLDVETDPIFTASAAYGITSINISNWDTAYGWGDHDGLYVGLTGNESIDGIKTFTSFPITPSLYPSTNYQVANKAYVDASISGGDYLDRVIAMQEDATLNPGSSPEEYDRYIILDALNLNVNFGNITGLENNDIVEYNGTSFEVIFDASAATSGVTVTVGTDINGNTDHQWYYNTATNEWLDRGDLGFEDYITSIFPIGLEGNVFFINEDNKRTTDADFIVKSGLIVENDDELATAQGEVITFEDVFNNWTLFSHFWPTDNYIAAGYDDPSNYSPTNYPALDPNNPYNPLTQVIFDEGSFWGYDDVNDRIYLTDNWNPYTGFISDSLYDYYDLEVTLSSDDTDDDLAAVIIAFYTDPDTGFEYTLSAVRQPGGLDSWDFPRWGLIYNMSQNIDDSLHTPDPSYPNESMEIIDSLSITGDSTGGWSTIGKTKIQVIRNKDIITIKSCAFTTGTPVIDDATAITIDLKDYAKLTNFRGPNKIGFGAQSQTNMYFSDLQFNRFGNYIFYNNGTSHDTYEYDNSTSTWNLQDPQTLTAHDYFGTGRIVESYLFNKLYFLEHDGTINKIVSPENADFNSPLTTKGDLLTYSTVDVRLPVGTDGQILSADSTETTGLKWIDQPSSMIYPAAGIAVSNGTSWNTSITPSTGYLYYDGSTFSWESVSSSLWSQNGSDIYYNGNVGIGTTNPEAALHVTGNNINSASIQGASLGNNGVYASLELKGASSTTGGGHIDFGYPNNDYQGRIIYYNSNNQMQFRTSATTRMTINGNGNILINTTTDSGYKLDVNGTGRFTGQITADGFINPFEALTSGSTTWNCSTGLSKTWSVSANATLTLSNLVNGMYGDVKITITNTPTITLAGTGITFKGNGSLSSLSAGIYHLCWVCTSSSTVEWNIAKYG